jgi:hypothetical protein
MALFGRRVIAVRCTFLKVFARPRKPRRTIRRAGGELEQSGAMFEEVSALCAACSLLRFNETERSSLRILGAVEVSVDYRRHRPRLETGVTTYLSGFHERRSVADEGERQRGQDYCPDCNHPFEIAAVKFSLSGNALLFVCPSCGLTKAETRAEAGRKLRIRIAELDRLMRKLKHLIRRP